MEKKEGKLAVRKRKKEKAISTITKQDNFINAYFDTLGHIGKSCAAAGISRQTYYDWCNNNPDFKEQLDQHVEHFNDNIIQVMKAKAHKGDNDMIKFWAKNKMKHRGFVDNQDATTNVTAINITFEKAEDEPKIIDQ